METQTVILTHDGVLAETCASEIHAMGFPAPLVAASVDELPRACTLLLIDLDSFPYPTVGRAAHTVGITRRDRNLPEELRATCDAVLHRPFALPDLRAVLSPLAGELSHRALPRRRMIARRPTASSKREIPSKELPLAPNENGTAIVVTDGVEIPLTKGEAAVFLALHQAAGSPVSREALAECLGSNQGSNLPDVHVCAIRKKLAPYGKDACIHTVRRRGYALLIP